MAPRTYISGFDPQKLAAASGQVENDPWKRFEAWRYQGHFSRWNRFKGALPGFGTATVLFGVYLVYEALFMKKKHKHSGAQHAEGH